MYFALPPTVFLHFLQLWFFSGGKSDSIFFILQWFSNISFSPNPTNKAAVM